MSVKFGIVGVGNIASFHAQAIELVTGAELTVCHSRTRDTGESWAQQHACDYASTLEELISRDDVDAVVITTPSGTHAEIGVLAAQQKKHILCEKPLDISVEKIDELIAACDANGVLLGAVFQSRFGAGAQALKKTIEQGRFGKLMQCSAYIPWYRSPEYYASAGWRGTWALDGGGALMNQGIHAIDLLLWLAGEVTEVSARVQTRLHEIEVEDNAVAWLQFKSGAVGVIQGSTACYPGESKRVEIKGESGSVTLIDDVPAFWEFAEASPADDAVLRLRENASIGGGASDPKAISVDGHRAQYEDFVAAIQQKRPPAIPGREGRRAVQVIRAIYNSSTQGAVVKL